MPGRGTETGGRGGGARGQRARPLVNPAGPADARAKAARRGVRVLRTHCWIGEVGRLVRTYEVGVPAGGAGWVLWSGYTDAGLVLSLMAGAVVLNSLWRSGTLDRTTPPPDPDGVLGRPRHGWRSRHRTGRRPPRPRRGGCTQAHSPVRALESPPLTRATGRVWRPARADVRRRSRAGSADQRASPARADTTATLQLSTGTGSPSNAEALQGAFVDHGRVRAVLGESEERLYLSVVRSQVPPQLRANPGRGVRAVVGDVRRQPLGRILVALAPVAGGGDRDQGVGAVLVVRIRLPPRRRPRRLLIWRGASFELCGIPGSWAPDRRRRGRQRPVAAPLVAPRRVEVYRPPEPSSWSWPASEWPADSPTAVWPSRSPGRFSRRYGSGGGEEVVVAGARDEYGGEGEGEPGGVTGDFLRGGRSRRRRTGPGSAGACRRRRPGSTSSCPTPWSGPARRSCRPRRPVHWARPPGR